MTVQPATAAHAAVPPRELAAALRAAGLNGVDDSARRRAEYSTDASNYRVVTDVVAFPRHAEEAAAALAVGETVRRAGHQPGRRHLHRGQRGRARHRAGLLPPPQPGAGRGCRGRTAVVEPGAVLDDITAAAAGYGLRFGPDPSTHARASIGGSIGNNACGSRALRYGRTADNVISLELLTAAGDRLARRAGGADNTNRADRRRAGRAGHGADSP